MPSDHLDRFLRDRDRLNRAKINPLFGPLPEVAPAPPPTTSDPVADFIAARDRRIAAMPSPYFPAAS
jgi:hypothetical protein